MGQGSTQSPSGRQTAPKVYKSATPALNEKLQRYREDPEALAGLQQRVRQHKAASRPASASFSRCASADVANIGSHSTWPCKSMETWSPRNFIEENAANVTPWPCTGPLSAQAISTAQQSAAVVNDSLESSSDDYSTSHSSPSSAGPSRPDSAPEKRQYVPPPPVEQPGTSSSNPFAQPQLQERPLSSDNRSPRPKTPKSPNSSTSRMQSATSRARSSACSSQFSIPSSPSQQQDSNQEGTTSTLELLGAHMAAKKGAAAARAVGAADRRAALAQAEQQRRLELSTRSERLEAERLAAQQAGAAAVLQLEQQELWSGVVVAVAATADLAAMLELRRRQGAAAAVIADAYKRCLIRRRHKEFIQLIIRMRRAIKPQLPRLLEAAHKRCAERVLLFLQRNTSSSMVLLAAHRFRHSVSLIQSHWRRVRMIRLAQENLLGTAMKQLEQQLVARNTSAAAQAALAAELESTLQQQGRFRHSRNHRAESASGSRGVSGSGGHNNSDSRRSNAQVHILEDGGTDVRARSGSDRSNSGSGQRMQQGDAAAAAPVVTPFMRNGNTLFMPDEFFLSDEASPSDGIVGSSIASPTAQRPGVSNLGSRPNTSGSSRGNSRPASPGLSAAATAAPHGPISPRGGYMTGQLTPNPRLARVPSSLPRSSSNNLISRSNSNSLQQGTAAGGHSSRGLGRVATNSRSTVGTGNNESITARANGVAAGAAGSSVGWHADVVDLEVEARLRDFFVPMPNDIRRQVVRKHLNGVRKVLIAEREAHAAAMKHYYKKLELEKLKHQLLKEAGVDAPISLLPPKPPRMKVLVSKDKLKLLIVEGMDMLQQQILAARLAREDAAGTGQVALDGRLGSNG